MQQQQQTALWELHPPSVKKKYRGKKKTEEKTERDKTTRSFSCLFLVFPLFSLRQRVKKTAVLEELLVSCNESLRLVSPLLMEKNGAGIIKRPGIFFFFK